MLVTDAGVLLLALADAEASGKLARARLQGERVYVPALADLEVMSALRRLVASGTVAPADAAAAVADLAVLPVQRVPHAQLLGRCWQLRNNVTPYDAAYVALAEALGAPLVTTDQRLAGAAGVTCVVEVLRS